MFQEVLAQHRVGKLYWPGQPESRKCQRVLRRIEAQGGLKEVAVNLDVVRRFPPEAHFERQPSAAAQAAHDVPDHRQGRIGDLAGAFDVRLMDRVAEQGGLVADFEKG